MTVQLNPERYQSDRLTFEREQFEKTLREQLPMNKKEYMLEKYNTGEYLRPTIQNMWYGWRLAKGMK